LERLAPSFVRDRCLYLSSRAQAHLQQEPEATVDVALQALPLVRQMGSVRSLVRLVALGRALAPWQGPLVGRVVTHPSVRSVGSASATKSDRQGSVAEPSSWSSHSDPTRPLHSE
jgi:hypothetical protein